MKKTLKSCCFILTIMLVCARTNAIACTCIGSNGRIRSLDELTGYTFIALVKITAETVNPFSDSTQFRTAKLAFKVIEKLKGKDIRELTEYDIQSSCDMGIQVGDEWVLFATERDGKISISACNRNVRYRDKDGVRDWHFRRGIEELEDLRKLYDRNQKRKLDGVEEQYYPDGKLEVETTYKDGLKNGEHTVYHRNGRIWGRQIFVNDSLQGKSEWFFPSGQLDDQKFYRKGNLVNKSRVYFDTSLTDQRKKYLIREFYETEDSLRKAYSHIQIWLEALYDANGQIISSREYSRSGKIDHEYFYHREDSHYTVVYYHENGQVKSIGQFKNYTKPYGRSQAYDPDGNPVNGKDYDENGKEIKVPIPK